MGPRRRRALGRVGAAAPLDRRRGLVGSPRGVQGLGQQHGDLGLEALRQSHGPPEGRDGLVEAPQVRRGLCENQISGAPKTLTHWLISAPAAATPAECSARTSSGARARTCVEIKIYGAFVLNHRIVLHAIDATIQHERAVKV